MSSAADESMGEIKSSTVSQLLALHEGALAFSGELDFHRLLQLIVESARQVTNSRYAALGVVDEDGLIELFFTSGISAEEREQMGELPRGHGLLGVLIKEGKPIRIPNIGKDQRSVGFPPNHPPMLTLLGMPIRYRGKVVGDLYLTDKQGGELWSDEDEWLTALLANHAAVAIGNAYLYRNLERERAQAEADRLRLSVILENLPDGVVVSAADGTITMLNPTAATMTGWRVGDSVYQRHFIAKQSDGSPYPLDELPLTRTLSNGQAVTGQHLIVEREGQPSADLLTSAAPLFDAQGQMNGAVVVYQDITALKSVERLKDDFFSMATHELRTPLTSINMSAGLLAELLAPQGGRVANLARLVDESARRMRTLVDDLLDLSRLEHGRLALHRRRFDLRDVATHAAQEIAPLAERKGQRLDLHLPTPGCYVEADAGRIEQVILNLLANAVKYTPTGGQIDLNIAEGNEATLVTVADNGPGVAEEERELIFEQFYRSAAVGDGSGTGLGLPIARRLVELHGGQMWLERREGGGSLFRFSLPQR